METVRSLLQLERCFLRELQIETRSEEALPPTEESEEEVLCEVEFQNRRHKEEIKFWATLGMTFSWPDHVPSAFQRIRIVLDAYYAFPADASEEDVSRYVPTALQANLIGFVRAYLAQVTALCDGGPFMLPLADINSKKSLMLPSAESEDEEAKG